MSGRMLSYNVADLLRSAPGTRIHFFSNAWIAIWTEPVELSPNSRRTRAE